MRDLWSGPGRGRLLATATALGAVLGLAVLGPVAPPTADARRAPFVAKLYAPGHHPKADKRWPITVTARTYSRKPLSGHVSYEFLHGGQVVARRSNYRFRNGRFHDATFTWPKRAAGIALTLQVVVRTRAGTVRLPYAVRVRR